MVTKVTAGQLQTQLEQARAELKSRDQELEKAREEIKQLNYELQILETQSELNKLRILERSRQEIELERRQARRERDFELAQFEKWREELLTERNDLKRQLDHCKETKFFVFEESKLYFSPEGFVHIPLVDLNELSANKFQDRVILEQLSAERVNQIVLAPGPGTKSCLKSEGWRCSHCTFLNKPRRPGCEMCANPRPDDYIIPDNTPLDTLQLDEKRNDELFQEFELQKNLREQEEMVRNYQELIQAVDAEVVTNKEEFDCPVCFIDVPPGEGVVLRECLHQFCKECLHDWITQCHDAVITCPFDDGCYECKVVISERDMKAVLTNEELEAVHKRDINIALPNSFHCKTADCRGFCFYEDEVNEFHCPVCDKRNCLLCKAIHEGMDCKKYQDDLKRRAANDEAAKATQNMLEELVQSGDAMKCPQCHIIIQEKDGCDWIRCSMCRTEICWATKGPRWGPKGRGDTSGGCKCRVGGKKCSPQCRNCH